MPDPLPLGVALDGAGFPTGLDGFVDKVVPLLQERGSLRADHTGTTLRDNLGLPALTRNPSRSRQAS